MSHLLAAGLLEEEKPGAAAPAPATAPILGILADRQTGVRQFGARGSTARLQDAHEDKLVTQRLVQKPCEIPSTARSTFLMAFSGDGSRIASTHGDHNIYVSDASTGKLVTTLRGHPRSPWCVAFHPTNSQLIASGCLGGEVRVWDLHGGSERWQADATHVIASLAFHPVDHVLVVATGQHLHFWNWRRPEPFAHTSTLRPKERLRYVKFDPLGFRLITAISNAPPGMDGLGVPGVRTAASAADELSGRPAGEAATRRSLEAVHRSLTRRYDQLHAQYQTSRSRRYRAEAADYGAADSEAPPRPLPVELEPAASAGLELARQYARHVTATAAAAAPGDVIADLEADSREMLSWAHGVMDSLSDIIADIRPDGDAAGVLPEPVHPPPEWASASERAALRRRRSGYTSGWDVRPGGAEQPTARLSDEFRSRLDAITSHVANMHHATRFRVEMGRQQASYVAQLQNIRDMLGSLQEQIRALYASLQRLPELPAVSGRPPPQGGATAATPAAEAPPAARRSGTIASGPPTRRTLLRRGLRHSNYLSSRLYRSGRAGREGASSSDHSPDPPPDGDAGATFSAAPVAGASRTRPLASHFCPRRRDPLHLRTAGRPVRNAHTSLRCAHHRLQHSLARCDQLTRQTQHQVMAAERQIRQILRQVSGSEPLTADQLRRRPRGSSAAAAACRQCGGARGQQAPGSHSDSGAATSPAPAAASHTTPTSAGAFYTTPAPAITSLHTSPAPAAASHTSRAPADTFPYTTPAPAAAFRHTSRHTSPAPVASGSPPTGRTTPVLSPTPAEYDEMDEDEHLAAAEATAHSIALQAIADDSEAGVSTSDDAEASPLRGQSAAASRPVSGGRHSVGGMSRWGRYNAATRQIGELSNRWRPSGVSSTLARSRHGERRYRLFPGVPRRLGSQAEPALSADRTGHSGAARRWFQHGVSGSQWHRSILDEGPVRTSTPTQPVSTWLQERFPLDLSAASANRDTSAGAADYSASTAERSAPTLGPYSATAGAVDYSAPTAERSAPTLNSYSPMAGAADYSSSAAERSAPTLDPYSATSADRSMPTLGPYSATAGTERALEPAASVPTGSQGTRLTTLRMATAVGRPPVSGTAESSASDAHSAAGLDAFMTPEDARRWRHFGNLLESEPPEERVSGSGQQRQTSEPPQLPEPPVQQPAAWINNRAYTPRSSLLTRPVPAARAEDMEPTDRSGPAAGSPSWRSRLFLFERTRPVRGATPGSTDQQQRDHDTLQQQREHRLEHTVDSEQQRLPAQQSAAVGAPQSSRPDDLNRYLESDPMWSNPDAGADLPSTLRRREQLGAALPRSVRPLLADLPPAAAADDDADESGRLTDALDRRAADALARLDRILAADLPETESAPRAAGSVDGSGAGTVGSGTTSEPPVSADGASSVPSRSDASTLAILARYGLMSRREQMLQRGTQPPPSRLRRWRSGLGGEADPMQPTYRRARNRMLLADFLSWRRRNRRAASSVYGVAGPTAAQRDTVAARTAGSASAEVGHRLGMLLDAARVVEERAAAPAPERPRRPATDEVMTPARARHRAWLQLRAGRWPPPAGSPEPSPLDTVPVDPVLPASTGPLAAGSGNADDSEPAGMPRIEVTGPPIITSTPVVLAPPETQPPRTRPAHTSSWANLAGTSPNGGSLFLRSGLPGPLWQSSSSEQSAAAYSQSQSGGSAPPWLSSGLDRAATGGVSRSGGERPGVAWPPPASAAGVPELPDVLGTLPDMPDMAGAAAASSESSPIIRRMMPLRASVMRVRNRTPLWNPSSVGMGAAGGAEAFGPLMADGQPGDPLGGYDSLMQVIGYPGSGYQCVSHRLQAWDFSRLQIPDMTDERRNLVCSRCKVHNDATVDISQDGRRLAAIVPESHPSSAVCVYSLETAQLGRLLHRVSLGLNTISVSLSPRGRHLVVGLASRRMVALPAESQVMAQIYCLEENSSRLVLTNELQLNSGDMPSRYVSINCIRWLPTPGAGLIFGTNRGKLIMLK